MPDDLVSPIGTTDDVQSAAGRSVPDVIAPPSYELLDFLGAGGMGVAYKARHRQLDRIVALKFIKSGSWATPAERERFLREARAAARVDHPNVVENEAPELTDTPRYPSKSHGLKYGLADGAGLWVFVLVASDVPLPSYHDWLAGHTLPSWKKRDTPPGTVWFDDGQSVNAVTSKGPVRADRAQSADVPGHLDVVRLTDGLKKETGATAVSAIGFAVLPRE